MVWVVSGGMSAWVNYAASVPLNQKCRGNAGVDMLFGQRYSHEHEDRVLAPTGIGPQGALQACVRELVLFLELAPADYALLWRR